MYPRLLNPLKSNSFFIFGARGTGKSTFLKKFFFKNKTLWIDLLIYEEESRYQENPDLLYDQVTSLLPEWCVIDEVQKVPQLLNTIHRLIEADVSTRFALTGSSARKLKRGGANLMAGRVFENALFPFTVEELGNDFILQEALSFGMLPEISSLANKEEKQEYLRSYTQTYLKEEIWSEHLIRNLPPFRKFLEVAAQMNGEILNYSKIGRIIQSDPKTVQKFFQILEDTFLGFYLESYHTSLRKKLIEAPKFFLFDPGVKRALDKTLTVDLLPGNYAYGKAFEHFIITQCHFLNKYLRKDFSFHFFKTRDGAEIDLVVTRPGKPIALIEIKSASKIDHVEVSNLKSLGRDLKGSECFCFSQDKIERKKDGVHYLSWEKGISLLFS